MGNPSLNMSRIERPIAPLLPSEAAQRAARLAADRVVIVCGGRGYTHRDRVWAALDRLHEREPITLLVHGACLNPRTGDLLGADAWADWWARERGVRVEPHPADWMTWGRGAGPMRNRQIARAGAHGLVAFPGGSGTASMIAEAEAEGIPVWRPFGAI